MALINCPGCAKRISSKAAVCSHCSLVLENVTEEKRLTMQKMSTIDKSSRIMNQSMLAMLLFCGGFGFMFWGDPEPASWQNTTAIGATVIGFIWYIVNRVRLILLKRS